MRFVPAPAALAPEVLGVVMHRAEGPAALPLPAHALAVFTVVLRGSLCAHGQRLEAGQVAASGPATAAQWLQGGAGLVCCSVLCRASVWPRLTGEPAHVFTDQPAPDAVLAALPVERWARLAADPANDAAIAAHLLALFGERLAAARAPARSAQRFATALAHWRPLQGRTSRLALPAFWSERAWQRACREELGVTPKFLQRLARLHASVRQQAEAPRGWAGHALDAGYSDQAHLVRDYRDLAGLSPVRSLGHTPGAAPALQLSAGTLAPRFFAA